MENLAQLHQAIDAEVLALLEPVDPVVVSRSELYLVDVELDAQLRALHHRLESAYEDIGPDSPDRKKYPFSKIVRHLNPGVPAQRYCINERLKKWKQINDPEKVLRDIEGEFEIWKNEMHKGLREHIEQRQRDGEAYGAEKVNEMYAVQKREFAQIRVDLDRVLDDFENLDVRISTYHHEDNIYSQIAFTLEDGTNDARHLSVLVPNVLFVTAATTRETSAGGINLFNPGGDPATVPAGVEPSLFKEAMNILGSSAYAVHGHSRLYLIDERTETALAAFEERVGHSTFSKMIKQLNPATPVRKFSFSKTRHTISFRDENAKQYNKSLSPTAANVLRYAPGETRPNNELLEYFARARNLFGDVFVAAKQA